LLEPTAALKERVALPEQLGVDRVVVEVLAMYALVDYHVFLVDLFLLVDLSCDLILDVFVHE
jgi:hypothetical protein